eukprot:gene26186-11912_t
MVGHSMHVLIALLVVPWAISTTRPDLFPTSATTTTTNASTINSAAFATAATAAISSHDIYVGPNNPAPSADLCNTLAEFLYTDPQATLWAPTTGLEPFVCTSPNQFHIQPDRTTVTVTFTVCSNASAPNPWLLGIISSPLSPYVASWMGYANPCFISIVSMDPTSIPAIYSWGRTGCQPSSTQPTSSQSPAPSGPCFVVAPGPGSKPPVPALCTGLAAYLYTDPQVTAWAPVDRVSPFACTHPNQIHTQPDGTITASFSACAMGEQSNGWLQGVIDNPVSPTVADFLGYNTSCTIKIESTDSCIGSPPTYLWGRNCPSPPPPPTPPPPPVCEACMQITVVETHNSPPPAPALCPILPVYLSTDPQIKQWAPTTGLQRFQCTSPNKVIIGPGGVRTVTFTVCAEGTTSEWLEGVRMNPVSQSVATFLGYNDPCLINITSSDTCNPPPFTYGRDCPTTPFDPHYHLHPAVLLPGPGVAGNNSILTPGRCGLLSTYLYTNAKMTALAPVGSLSPFVCTEIPSNSTWDGYRVSQIEVCAMGDPASANTWQEGAASMEAADLVTKALGYNCDVFITAASSCGETSSEMGTWCEIPLLDYPHGCFPGNSVMNGGQQRGAQLGGIPYRARSPTASGSTFNFTIDYNPDFCTPYTPKNGGPPSS